MPNPLKKKLIDTPTIGGYTLYVYAIEDLIDNHEEAGYYDPDRYEIGLDASLNPTAMADTYLHELIHAIEAIYGFELEHSTTQILAVALQQATGMQMDGGVMVELERDEPELTTLGFKKGQAPD